MIVLTLVVTAVQAAPTACTAPYTPPASDPGQLVVYWGANDAGTSLDDVCSDPAYGIVNLAFVNQFFAAGGYPEMAISGLFDSSPAQQAAGATGLKDGSSLIDAIKSCQSNGKLVMISLGGYLADVTLASDQQGQQMADLLWNLFLGGTEDCDLRPFGSVKLDGFNLGKKKTPPLNHNVP